MHATSSYENSGSKVTKIAIVTLLHAAMALALIGMKVTLPAPVKEPTVFTVDPLPKPIPPVPQLVEAPPPNVLPPLYVPRTEVPTQVAPQAPTLTTTNVLPTALPIPATHATISEVIAPPMMEKVVAKPAFHAAQAGECSVPNYPAASARNGDSGTVGLALLIAPDGHVADSKVTGTSGFRELDRAAIAALSLCKFKPATTNGVPESAWGKIAYVWTLEQ